MEKATGQYLPAEAFRRIEVYAFCGFGNPEAFRRTLCQTGCVIAGFRTFPDHHPYSARDLEQIEHMAGQLAIVTTEKDAVRLPRALGWSLVVESEVPALAEMIQQRISPK